VPDVQPTLPSPLQYGYRTKLTPHFEPPSKEAKAAGDPAVSIGFEERGRKRVVDIEQCPIATSEINAKLVTERHRVKRCLTLTLPDARLTDSHSTINTFKRGATLLLRHALYAGSPADQDAEPYCETNHRETVQERIGSTIFEFTAGALTRRGRDMS
jgi:tRNA (uracil-5-)-methyltransferase